MKKIIFILLTVILLATSCAKKIPGFRQGRISEHEYDSATYSYLYTEALRLKLLGNFSEALKILEQCIKINPVSDAPYFHISQILFQTGRNSEGKIYALKAYEKDNKNVWYLNLLGGIYQEEENYDSAAYFYEKILKINPEKDEVKLALANIYSEKGDTLEAGKLYSVLNEKYGLNETILMSEINNLVKRGRYNDAENRLRKLLEGQPDNIMYNGILAEILRTKGDNSRALDVYNKLMDIDPSSPQTLMSLADFLLEAKYYNELVLLLNTIILNDKIEKEQKIGLLSKCIENEDFIKTRGNDLELALRVLEAAYTKDMVTELLRPDYYVKSGKTEVAQKRLEEIISVNPDNYYAWEKLLLIYSDTRQNEKLFVAGRECATRFNRSYLAKLLYASAASEIGNFPVALEELRKAKILAGNQNELLVQALILEADVFYRMNEKSKAFETYREALKIDPENSTLLNNYAYFLAEDNVDLANAENMARRVIEKEGDNTTFLDTYAWVLYKRGKYKEALKVMNNIISRGEEDADWFEHYGYILKAVKKCKEAIFYWSAAVELDSTRVKLQKEIETCRKK